MPTMRATKSDAAALLAGSMVSLTICVRLRPERMLAPLTVDHRVVWHGTGGSACDTPVSAMREIVDTASPMHRAAGLSTTS